MALSEYDKQRLSAEQQAKILDYTNRWHALDAEEKTATPERAAQIKQEKASLNTSAESIRAGTGYLGGQDGTGYTPVEQQAQAPAIDLTSKVEDYSSYIEEMNRAKKAAALADIEAAYQSNVNALDRAGEGLEKSYQDARNQTAGASELAKRNFAQYAAANGLNSGTGGQAELARNVALQGNLNTINAQEAQSVADLQLQRANAEVEYNNAIAQAQSEGNYELANALYQEKVRVQNALIEQETRQYQLEYQAYRDKVGDIQWKQSFDQDVDQQDWQNQFQERESLASYGAGYLEAGIMPSAEMLEAMGITEADAQAYINNYQNNESKSQSDAQKKTLASYGASYLEAGVMPSAEMLEAMGITEADAQAYINNYQSNESKSQNETQQKTLASYGAAYLEAGVMPSAEMLKAMGITEADAKTYITAVKNADGANYTMVGEALTDMVRAGAGLTELRSALRGALNEGILTQAEYEQLCGIYLPDGWRT